MPDKLYAGLTYEQIVRKYSQTVANVCLIRLQNYADAEDCFQNTFVKLFTNSPQFTGENHLKAWLIRVAINECVTCVRKNKLFIPLKNVNREETYFTDDTNDVLWALLKTPQKYREVLYLHYCEQCTVKDIAEILKINENTVKTRLRRGREKLKSIYGGDERE